MTTTTPQPRSKRERPLQSSPGETSIICPVCLDCIIDATEDSDGQEAIFCESICNSWIHRQCAGLSQALFKILEESEEPFYCPHCRLIAQDKQLRELKTMVEDLSKEVVSLKASVSDHQPVRSSTSQQQPQKEIQMASNNATSTTSKQTQPPTTTNLTNRPSDGDHKFNVVIYGIDECSKGTPRRERLDHDLDKVTTIVTEAESSINPLSIRDLIRLGKYREQSKKPRPILIRFNRAIDTSLLLSKASKLPKDIKVKPDMSHEERHIESLLLKERWHLIHKGTDRKTIKIRSNKLFVQNKLFGEVTNSIFVPSQSPQARADIDTSNN